ncbi:MAG: DUF4388 domain-containing protein [Acidobacteriota bacterium]|nr:DUF4388 domain-containing protein [Acidobacteriota bacterium]
MAIHGDLRTMPVAELLRWVGSENRTGTLELERNSIHKRIVFRDGRVVACGSDDPATLLGQYLLSRGAITREQLQAALREQECSGKNLGEIFVGNGSIAKEEEADFVRAKAEETIYGVFDWDDAIFRFEVDAPSNPNLLWLELEIDEIIRRGHERQEDVSDASDVLQDDAVILARTGVPAPSEVTGDAVAVRILQLIDGERTIAELLLLTHAPEFVVRKLLVGLLRGGQVEMKKVAPQLFDSDDLLDDLFGDAPPDPPAPVAAAEPERPEASVKGEIEVALGMMRNGQHERALALLRAISAAHPGDSSIRELIAEAESDLQDDLTSADLSPEKVPVLVKPLKATVESDLSPHELFIVGLIDGVADVKGITWVAPMREVETLKVIKGLKDRNLVILTSPAAAAAQ